MKRISNLVLAAFFCANLLGQASGIKEPSQKVAADTAWTKGGGIGFDFAQLALINPKVGGGDNRLGLGGLLNYFANMKKGKIRWENDFSLQLSVQKLGKADAQKNLDVLRLGSKFSHATFSDKLSTAVLATFESQFLPTYPGNFLKSDTASALSKFASPMRFNLAPGIDYKPDAHFTFFLSPAALRLIFVADEDIAALGVHGNEPIDFNDPSLGFKKSAVQVGANFVGAYKNKFWGDKILFLSKLDLYSNYRHNPQNIDMLWTNDLGVVLFKNFSINLLVEAFYDDDVKLLRDRNVIDDFTDDDIGRATSITEALLIKYNVIF